MNLVSIIQSISARLATVTPAVLDKVRSTLGISNGGDVLGKIRKYIAENPVSAATVASILASNAPEVVSDMMATEPKEVADSLREILPGFMKYSSQPEMVMGDRTPEIVGYDIDSLSQDTGYIKTAIDRIEFIAGILAINPKRVGEFVVAIQALEPQDQKIYNIIKG